MAGGSWKRGLGLQTDRYHLGSEKQWGMEAEAKVTGESRSCGAK